MYIYGPNSAGREKSAWNVLNLPALQESPSPNGWSGKLVLLVSWLSMVCEYLTEFSPCRDHLKVPNRVIEVSGKNCFEANFQFYTVWHCNQNYVHQEAENSVRYSQTIDNQYTKRTRLPDQPFGLGDSWSAGKFKTFQAFFPSYRIWPIYLYSNQLGEVSW